MSFKKIIIIFTAVFSLFCATAFFCGASEYSISEYVPSSTYVEYLGNIDFGNEKYILFRSQNSIQNSSSHILATGEDLAFDRNTGKISGSATLFVYENSNPSKFYTLEDENFSVTYKNQIIYSNFIEGIPSISSTSQNSFHNILIIFLSISLVLFFIIVVWRLIRG